MDNYTARVIYIAARYRIRHGPFSVDKIYKIRFIQKKKDSYNFKLNFQDFVWTVENYNYYSSQTGEKILSNLWRPTYDFDVKNPQYSWLN